MTGEDDESEIYINSNDPSSLTGKYALYIKDHT